MAKKNAKPVKKKPVNKAPAAKKAAKVAPKKVAKPVKKVAAPKKPIKKAAPVKPAKKVAAPAKAAAPKKVELKKVTKAPIPEAKKKVAPEKPEKVAKGKVKAPEVEEIAEVEEPGEEEEAEIVLTDAEGRRYCRVKDCDQLSSVDGYCRYHYLLFWKRIQVRKKILTEGKLERYVEELTARYPDKFLEILRKDLRSEKDFQGAIQELEIDESAVDNEFEDEAQTYIDEVRGDVAPAREEEDF